MRVLSENAVVKVNNRFLTLKAILAPVSGGRVVVYVDSGGNEVHREPLNKSQFKALVKNNENESGGSMT